MQMKIFMRARTVLLSGFLALLVTANASADNFSAPRWIGDSAGGGFGSCQAAYDAFLTLARQFNNDPLIVFGPSCDQAMPTMGGAVVSFHFDYRRTYDFPTTPNR